jgi:hypothetical protein
LPRVELRFEPPSQIGVGSNEIRALAEVRANVEEKRAAVVDDELPIAGSHRGLMATSCYSRWSDAPE